MNLITKIDKYKGKWLAYKIDIQKAKEKLEELGLSKFNRLEEIITEANILAYGNGKQEVEKKVKELGLSDKELKEISYTKIPKTGAYIYNVESPEPKIDKQILKDLNWAAEHNLELSEKYFGKMIGIYKGKVIGTIDEICKLEQEGKLPVSRNKIAEYWVDDGSYVSPDI